MNPVTTTSVGVTIAGATATLQWLAASRGITVPDAVSGFIVALILGATHGAWQILTVFVPRLGTDSVQPSNAGSNASPNVGS